MTKTPTAASDWLYAVGHPHRVEILRCFLTTGTATPVDVASILRLPLGTVSYHIRALAQRDLLKLTGRTQRRGASVHHYQLSDRERAASLLWGTRAALLVSDFARENGRGDHTAELDTSALAELRTITATYIARIGELGLQARERRDSVNARDSERPPLTQVAVLLAINEP